MQAAVKPLTPLDAERHLDHPALLYGSQAEFLESMVPYVMKGVEAGDFVFVAARADNLEALQAEIGDAADEVLWADTEQWHPQTGPRLRAFYDMARSRLAAGAKHLRLAGEPVWPAGPPELVLEWQRYESVLNEVLAPFPATLVCLYDTSRLNDVILESARWNHPMLLSAGVEQPNAAFRDADDALKFWSHEIAPPPASAAIMLGTLDLPTGRRFVREHAIRAGVDELLAADIGVAVSEILSNAFIHGGGPTALWVWTQDGRFVCQVDDVGPGVADPIAGYRPPTDAIDGRGLWIVRQLVDLIQISTSNNGACVRIHTWLDRRP